MSEKSVSILDGYNQLHLLEGYNIIEDDLQDVLDGLTELATASCNCSSAFISFKTDENWIVKASRNFEQETLPYSSVLLHEASQRSSALEIDDIKSDKRFFDDALVGARPGIRYVAVAPFSSQENIPPAVICVMDNRIHNPSDQQKNMLRLVAKQASSRLKQHLESIQQRKVIQQKNIFLRDATTLQAIIDEENLNIRDVNSGATSRLGGEKSDYIGRPFGKNIISSEDLEKIHRFLLNDTSKQGTFEAWTSMDSGEKRYYELTFSKHGDCWYLTARDRTEKHQLEIERQRRNKAMEASMDGIAITNEDGEFTYVNDAYVKKFGYNNKNELTGESWEINYKPKTVKEIEQAVSPALEKEGRYRGETTGIRKDGIEINLEMSISEIGDGNYIAIVRDITKRKEMEQKLNETLHTLKYAQNMAKLGTWKWQVGSDKIERSEEIYNIFGYEPDEAGESLDAFFELVHPEDREKVHQAFNDIISGKKIEKLRHRIITSDGETKHIQLKAISYQSRNDGGTSILGISQDVTEQVQNMQRLRKSLEEKEVLLSEVHHRVKNNLAVISGLLQLESFETKNPDVELVLRENQMRIHSMAAIHELLYRDSDFSRVPFHSYLNDILSTIQDTFEDKTKEISIATEFNKVELNVNQAVPCGLMVNEIVVNAFEHAFQNRETGTIELGLQESDSIVNLRISDNGIGFANNSDGSLGTTLIRILAKQLNAELDIQSDGGIHYDISFKKSAKRGSSSAFLN